MNKNNFILKKGVFFVAILLLLLLMTNIGKEGFCSSENPTGHGAVHAAPAAYKIQWSILGGIFFLSCVYIFQMIKFGKKEDEEISLAYLFVVLVFSYYCLGYLPSVRNYHASPNDLFLRFIVMVINTGLVTFYGVLGRHDEHGHEDIKDDMAHQGGHASHH